MRSRPAFRRRVLTKKWKNSNGIPELITQLDDIAESVQAQQIYDVLFDAARIPMAEAIRSVPVDETRKRPRIAKGGQPWPHLRDAFFVSEGDPSKDKKGPTVLVGPSTRKAPQSYWLEKGTRKMQARPFWRQVLAATRPQIAERIASGLKAIISKAAGKLAA